MRISPVDQIRRDKMRKLLVLPVVLSLFAGPVIISGCAGMSDTQQRTVSGAAIGAAGGALVTGGSTKGAVLGAGVGALGGYAYDQHKKAKGE
jgi:hypothetical protein